MVLITYKLYNFVKHLTPHFEQEKNRRRGDELK